MVYPKKKQSVAIDADHSFSVMLLGDSCTGKTCILIRFKDGTFLNSNFISTVGIDYRNKVVSVNNKLVKLQIFDTAGQERFRSVTSAYYRDADALLVVFDVTNRKSFENVRSWVSQIKDFAKDNVVITLIGNKSDLSAQRVVKPAECNDLAAFYNIPYIETSAKTGARIEDVFLLTAKRLIAAANGESITEDVIDISASSQPSYWSSCCYGSGKASST